MNTKCLTCGGEGVVPDGNPFQSNGMDPCPDCQPSTDIVKPDKATHKSTIDGYYGYLS